MRFLKRTIVRRVEQVDNLVVKIDEAGITLRKFRRRGSKSARTISWEDLYSLLGANAHRTRSEAFDYMPNHGWCPKVGESVYLHSKYKYARGIVATIHPAVPEPFITVDVRGGHSKIVALRDLRPAPPPAAAKDDGQKKLI